MVWDPKDPWGKKSDPLEEALKQAQSQLKDLFPSGGLKNLLPVAHDHRARTVREGAVRAGSDVLREAVAGLRFERAGRHYPRQEDAALG